MDQSVKLSTLSRLADFVVDQHVIDHHINEVVRLALIDTLGCIFIGAKEAVTQHTLKTVSVWGEGNVPVFGTTNSLPPPWAAVVNGVAAHCLDLDDWEIPGNSHPSAVIFPALLAVVHQQQNSGAELVQAYVAGFEVIARLGEAMNFEHYDKGWHTTSTLAAIGAAAAVSNLLKLDTEKTATAMSLSVSMAAGLTRQFGSSAKPLHAGLAAKAGLMAASFAANGLTGQADVIEGERGYNQLTADVDELRFDRALESLGERLALKQHGLVVKAYPACGYTHRLVDCALDIHQQFKGELPEIKRITASLPDFHAAILPFLKPKDRRQALFSAPYCCAVALTKGRLTLADFEPNELNNPAINALIAITELDIKKPINPKLNYDPDQPDWLEVEDINGNVVRSECAYPLGAPQNPMTAKQIYQKFESLSGFKPPESLINWTDSPNINLVIEELNT